MTSPSIPTKHEQGTKEVLTSKWTMVNDHWIEAQFLLARGKSGLSDKPAFERTDK